MSDARAPGVVVDTMVISWLFADQPHPLAERYRALIDARPVLLAFQTVMELRFGASGLAGASCVGAGSNGTSRS
ncbi:MAG TPA: hypothetical protein VMZ51_03055 [Acidimicrobiales bacterium]|nr:hypothetical protein [Acidimicrobiales bacterium]